MHISKELRAIILNVEALDVSNCTKQVREKSLVTVRWKFAYIGISPEFVFLGGFDGLHLLRHDWENFQLDAIEFVETTPTSSLGQSLTMKRMARLGVVYFVADFRSEEFLPFAFSLLRHPSPLSQTQGALFYYFAKSKISLEVLPSPW